MRGISLQDYSTIGGLFQEATNFDPFERMGLWIPAIEGTRQGASVMSSSEIISYFVPSFEANGIGALLQPILYGFGDSNTLIRINAVSSAVTDVSNVIAGITTIRGATKHKDRIIYANDTKVMANSTAIAAGAEVTLITAGGFVAAEHVMVTGPDRNLYIANKNSIARVTSVTGTANNGATYLTFEDDVIVRDLKSDGKYLIIAADANEFDTGSLGRYRCLLAFWNMKSQDLSQYWEFTDNRVYACQPTEDEVLIFCSDGIYTCSLTARPRKIYNFRGNASITRAGSIDPATVVEAPNGTILFGMGDTVVYGYGRPYPGMNKIFFKAFTLPSGAGNVQALYRDGNKLWVSTSNGRLYETGTSSTRLVSTAVVAGINFVQPYRFAYARISTRTALSSGQSVALRLRTLGANRNVLSQQTFSNATHGAVSSFIFRPETSGTASSDAPVFDGLSQIEMVNTGGVDVERVEIYGYPLDPSQVTGI